MRIRPKEVISVNHACDVIEHSIKSVIDWSEKTGNRLYDLDERLEYLNELLDIIFELSSRYGKSNVGFKFSNKKKIPGAIDITEVIETDHWNKRIHIIENTDSPSIVYINF